MVSYSLMSQLLSGMKMASDAMMILEKGPISSHEFAKFEETLNHASLYEWSASHNVHVPTG